MAAENDITHAQHLYRVLDRSRRAICIRSRVRWDDVAGVSQDEKLTWLRTREQTRVDARI
jgi:hypothetical protein